MLHSVIKPRHGDSWSGHLGGKHPDDERCVFYAEIGCYQAICKNWLRFNSPTNQSERPRSKGPAPPNNETKQTSENKSGSRPESFIIGPNPPSAPGSTTSSANGKRPSSGKSSSVTKSPRNNLSNRVDDIPVSNDKSLIEDISASNARGSIEEPLTIEGLMKSCQGQTSTQIIICEDSVEQQWIICNMCVKARRQIKKRYVEEIEAIDLEYRNYVGGAVADIEAKTLIISESKRKVQEPQLEAEKRNKPRNTVSFPKANHTT